MNNRFWLVSSFSLWLGAFAPSLLAGEEHRHEGYSEHGSHVHGLASLFVVQDGDELLVELESPGINLVGFEHQARTQAEQESIAELKRLLENEGRLISLNGGDCQLMHVETAMPGLDKDHDEHEHEHEHEVGHGEVHAQYRFHCQQPKDLQAIELTLFKEFANLQEVKAQWIVGDRQGAATLSAENRLIELQ